MVSVSLTDEEAEAQKAETGQSGGLDPGSGFIGKLGRTRGWWVRYQGVFIREVSPARPGNPFHRLRRVSGPLGPWVTRQTGVWAPFCCEALRAVV